VPRPIRSRRHPAHRSFVNPSCPGGRRLEGAGRPLATGRSDLLRRAARWSTGAMAVEVRSFTAPGTVTVRRVVPADDAGVTRFYASLSADSLEARFLGATPGIAEATARFFCGPDHLHREGLVAEAIDGSGECVIVGHLCLEPSTAGRVEMAIAVADGWQRRGIGRALLEAAIRWAEARGSSAWTRLRGGPTPPSSASCAPPGCRSGSARSTAASSTSRSILVPRAGARPDGSGTPEGHGAGGRQGRRRLSFPV